MTQPTACCQPARTRRALPAVLLAALLATLLALVGAAPAAADDHLDVVVELDGREAAGHDANDPLVLDPDEPVMVAVTATNAGSDEVFVRSVRLRSRVMGLTFLSYETGVHLEVPAGGTATVTFELDLLDLRNQATGLLPTEVELLDAERDAIATVPLTADVQGSMTSVYGAFGLAIAAITLLSLGLALFRLATGRLPANRWARGLQFAAPGAGLGLVVTIGLSTLRVFAPAPGLSATLLIGLTIAGFALGYLTPQPGRDDVVELGDLDVALEVGDATSAEPDR